MNLYDQAFINDLPSLSTSEPTPMVVRLCKDEERGLLHLRSRMEHWFACLPQAAQDKLKDRLRSFDDDVYFAAFAELFFGAYLCSNWGTLFVKYEPNIGGKNPDWSFRDLEMQPVLFEVTSIRIMPENQEGYSVVKHLRSKIEEKISRYKAAKTGRMQLVVALVSFSDPDDPIDSFNVETAMYGDKKLPVQLSGTPQSPSAYHTRCGICTKWNADGLSLNTSLSALVWCRKYRSWDGEFEFSLRVFHNPFATNPLSCYTFDDWPQFVESERTDELVFMNWDFYHF